MKTIHSELYKNNVIAINDDLPIVHCFRPDGHLIDAYYFEDFDNIAKGIEIGRQIIDKVVLN